MEVLHMKTAMKIISALAAVVGAIYVIATYGDKIVSWAKNLLKSCPCNDCEVIEEDFITEEAAEEAAPAEEAPAEEAPEAEEAAEEIVVESNEPVAEEKDFAE